QGQRLPGSTSCRLQSVRLAAAVLAAVSFELPRAVAKFVLPSSHVDEENASFYVFRDDIVLFPISYSIPKENIKSILPEKTAFAINDSTRSGHMFKRYQFGPLQEEEYHQNLQRHRFGDTRRKGGYDCLRHYELLANGVVPIIAGLEMMPQSILTTLPRKLLMEAKHLFALPWWGTQDGPGECPAAGPGAYEALASELLQVTANELSTESAAKYVLSTMDIALERSKVLFLPCSPWDNFPSYLTASVFHGLVSLLGDQVIDVPEYEYAYELESGGDQDAEASLRSNIWGQGFTLGFKLKRRPHLDRANISARIRANEFDLIVFARMSPYEPCNFWGEFGGLKEAVPEYWPDVMASYPRERVALLYGDDSGLDDAVMRTHLSRFGALSRGFGYVFQREMLPFVEEGPDGQTLRPVDGRLVQPGCFNREWLDFFERWWGNPGTGEIGGLRACAAWGHCGSEEVDGFMDSDPFFRQWPPEDPSVLKHFCSAGCSLKAAVLVQRHGPDGCQDDELCKGLCDFSLRLYSRGLMDIPPELFFDEFGVTPHEVIYVLSQGCGGGKVALQPAAARHSRDVIFVADGPALTPSAGPLAGEWQARYFTTQGFSVHLVGTNLVEDEVPPRLWTAYDHGRLQLRNLPKTTSTSVDFEGLPCDWLKLDGAAPLLVHFDLSRGGRASEVARCLLRGERSQRPQFVSMQLPLVSSISSASSAASTASSAAWQAIATLLAAGYRGFKVSRLASSNSSGLGLGSPFGELAVDARSGLRWRSSEEVLAAALPPGAQIHATL
ncbi:unnamed protein product, partial [Polarella glacialis]